MAPSSGTSVVAREDLINTARAVIMLNIWHFERHDEWPTLTHMAQRDSWRGAAVRRESREYLLDNDYLTVDGDRRGEVTPRGRIWVEAPSFDAGEPAYLEIPSRNFDDEQDVVTDTFLFVESFWERRQRWPNAVDLKGAGVRRRVGAEDFKEALDWLVEHSHIVRISLRNGDRVSTYTISTRRCPWLKDKHGLTFWWPTQNGPLPGE